MPATYTEIAEDQPIPPHLAEKVIEGEVFVIRRCLQRLGVFDEIAATSLNAIKSVAGRKAADDVEREGFDTIHRHTSLDQLEAVTDKIHDRAIEKASDWVAQIAPGLLGINGAYYFERGPNVRFHVPYDVMAEDPEIMSRFAAKSGGGKLAPHPNHRDSWVGCPDNLINVWSAVGPIPEGNGLTIFPEAFTRDVARVGASIAFDENPGDPLNFNLEPGDTIVFHGEHVHSSVLNRTDGTRHAVSFRIVNEKPHFPNSHYHQYVHSSLAGGPFNALAGAPANMAWSYVETRLGGAAKKLGIKKDEAPRQNTSHAGADKKPLGGTRSFNLSQLDENSLHAITDDICVARIGKDKLAAFDRKCPHGGGDLALGTVIDGEITCPWHNLRFDPKTGASACQTLKKVRMYDINVEGDTVTVKLDEARAPTG